MKKLIALLAVGLVMGVCGCAGFQNYSIKDLRVEKNVIKTGIIQKSIENINKCSLLYNKECGPSILVNIDPDDNKKGFFVYYGPGLTQANPYIIIDFEETGINITNFKAYAYYSASEGLVDRFISNINDCGMCIK